MYIVKCLNACTWYLKASGVWTGERERAGEFPSNEAAQAALLKAKLFTNSKIWKNATVERIAA